MASRSHPVHTAFMVVGACLLTTPAFGSDKENEKIETPEVEDDRVDDVPLLGAPRADEQKPPPVMAPEEPEESVRTLEVGPSLGFVNRAVQSDTISYTPAATVGVHARAGLMGWLSARVLFFNSTQEISLYGSARHPPVNVLSLGAHLEPTWPIRRDLRLWVAVGVSWERLKADPWVAEDTTLIPKRTGTMLNYSAGLGSTWEAWPNRLGVTLSLSLGTLQKESGTLFESAQGFGADGHRVLVASLPTFSTESAAALAVEVIL